MSFEHKDEEGIFKAVIKLKTSLEREAYLKKACGGNAELQNRLEILLRAHEQASDFLEVPPFHSDLILDKGPISEAPGTIIGRYKLLEKIGEGGMAVVYMAEQERPLHRKVALKIIKLGMDTRQVIARFEAERQALAMMDHPNIAKVLDAGSTETGRPYFVMELVTGVSITKYCDKNNLNTKERLTLFIQVCNAVQHAHQKGIIHRDIKPTNVMVTLHDSKPIPKVIDFGIAKAINQKLTEKTLFTRYAHMIGTPAYMSPEQAEMSGLDVDTRTDIYSLGVLLYELLTGTTPFDTEKLNKASPSEMQRIICEEEPTKPSTKLSSLKDSLAGIARHRSANPDILPRVIQGDLDWIVMKALDKDRIRRYDTATELAVDIKRHLNNETVEAAAPSASYRLSKFIKRNRTLVVTGILIAASLLIGTAVAIIGLIQAKNQRQRAEVNLHLALQTLDDVILKESPEYELGLRQTFDLLEKLSIKHPKVPDYRWDLVKSYAELSTSLNAGQADEAEEHYLNALTIVENLQSNVSSLPEYRHPLALIHNDLGLILKRSGQEEKIKSHYRQAADLFEKLLADSPDESLYHAGLSQSQKSLAKIVQDPVKSDLKIKAFNHIMLAIRLIPNQSSYRRMLVRQCRDLGNEQYYAQAISLLKNFMNEVPASRYELSFLLADLGMLLKNSGQLDKSKEVHRQAQIYWQDVTANNSEFQLIFGTPAFLGLTVNSTVWDGGPSISSDGLSLFFDSSRSDEYKSQGLWLTKRDTKNEKWGEPVDLGPIINSTATDGAEWQPCISADGLSLFFVADWDLWVTTRQTTKDDWNPPKNLGSTVNSSYQDICPSISADGLSLFFSSTRPGGLGGADIWISTRETKKDEWGTPENLGPTVNSQADENGPSISADGLMLFFTDFPNNRPGGRGGADLWVAWRKTKNSPWCTPKNLGPTVNSTYDDIAPSISADGSILFFASERYSGSLSMDLWQVPILSLQDGFQKHSNSDETFESIKNED